jgi:pyruvate,orthophosphate dikinase
VTGTPTERPTDPTSDDVARVLLVKGASTDDQLAESLVADRDRLNELVEQLIGEGMCERAAGQLRLTGSGKLKAGELIGAERAAATIDEERANALIEEFHALDSRMKQIVTDWQVRDVAGEQTLNDHTDAAYDARVLDELAALHADTSDWLQPLGQASRQFGVYGTRLARALDTARAGDQRFVASPRVDSYHGVWFELHEHLIRLTGRSRSAEAAAGRA